jgi:hypothetical protein
MPNASRDVLIDSLRRLLSEAFTAHQRGGSGAQLGRAYGKADGFMLALIESGLATQQEMSTVVLEERTRGMGPSTKILSSADATSADSARSGETLAA